MAAMLPTHDVPCPRCSKPLYSSTGLDDGINAGSPEAPKVESGADGLSMRCPHCGMRIAMERVSARGGEELRPAAP